MGILGHSPVDQVLNRRRGTSVNLPLMPLPFSTSTTVGRWNTFGFLGSHVLVGGLEGGLGQFLLEFDVFSCLATHLSVIFLSLPAFPKIKQSPPHSNNFINGDYLPKQKPIQHFILHFYTECKLIPIRNAKTHIKFKKIIEFDGLQPLPPSF